MKAMAKVQGKGFRGFRNENRTKPGNDQRIRLKEVNVKRSRIVQTVVAGHVRGGHSFH